MNLLFGHMISFKKVSKKFNQYQGVETTSLTIEDGKTTVLIGPSGCGKSTLLRLIVGLITPTTGEIFFDHEEVNKKTAAHLRRKIGYVIQDGGLFPHLTARNNLSLVAKYHKISMKDIKERILSLCELVKLPPKILDSYPLELSGGERQRVSLMRALMLDPNYILLDEPLASLDPITRYELQDELKLIFSHLQKTVILVTHDMKEAAYLGHEIILMRGGKIVQKGPFKELVHKPKEPFVTTFIQAQQYTIESME